MPISLQSSMCILSILQYWERACLGATPTRLLYMQGISDRWTLSQAAVLSIIAGNDLIEGPYSTSQVAVIVAALKQAMQQSKLSIDRINQSVERILLMKVQYGII